MQQNPLVSIICLCYNHENYVVQCLESIVNQSYDAIEIIIADDCSQDNSVAVIEKWLQNHPEVIFVKNTANQGNTKTFNSVLKLAKGKFIIDLATDDVLKPNCVAFQLEQFKNSKYQNLGIVYGNLELIDQNNKHLSYFYKVDANLKRINPQPTGDIYLGLLNFKNNVCSVGAMTKKTVYDDLKGYDESLFYEDYDFWIRAARSFEFDFIDKILVQKRIMPNTLSDARFRRFNPKTKLFNESTYRMIVKNQKLNRTKTENRAMIRMVRFEMWIAMKTLDVVLFLKYIPLVIKLWFS